MYIDCSFKAVGANCKLIVHVPPGPRVTGGERGEYGEPEVLGVMVLPLQETLVIENSVLEPSKEMPLTANEELLPVPVFVRVSTWIADVFTSTSPKLIGPPVGPVLIEYCAYGPVLVAGTSARPKKLPAEMVVTPVRSPMSLIPTTWTGVSMQLHPVFVVVPLPNSP
jgi:hypothetical protein